MRSEPLAQAILNYLVTKPYGEVFQLIIALQSLRKIEEIKEKQNDDSILPSS